MINRGEMPSIPSRIASRLDLLDVFLRKPSTSSPSYSFIFLIRLRPACSDSSRRDMTANIETTSSVCGAMWISRKRSLSEQLRVDAHLLGHLKVVGDAHGDHAVLQRLGFWSAINSWNSASLVWAMTNSSA